MDLESRNVALQSELDNATPASLSMRHKDPSSWLPKPQPRYSLESHRNAINCIAFHPIFSVLATGSDDYTIKIWDWDVGELERTIKGHTRGILDVDFGGPRSNTLLASCSSDLTIKLWDPADDYKNIRTLSGHDHSVSAVRFIPASANLLVSASRDKTLKIWDVSTGFCVRTLKGHAGWVRDVFPSFDGRYLLSAGDDMSARLWDISVATNTESKQTMFGHEHHIECCALAPPAAYQYLAPMAGLKKPPPAGSSAEFMATGSRDKTIRRWDARGVKGIGEPHERFSTSLRWAPSIVRNIENGDAAAGSATPDRLRDRDGSSRTAPDGSSTNGTGGAKAAQDIQIRCVVATGGVDCKLRIFSN